MWLWMPGEWKFWHLKCIFLVLFYRTVFVLYVLTLFNEGANLTWVHKALKDSILFIYLFLKERASVFLLMFSAKQGKYCFIMSLVWLGIEPRTYVLEASTLPLGLRGMICRTGRRDFECSLPAIRSLSISRQTIYIRLNEKWTP